jgi:hypothetical protein
MELSVPQAAGELHNLFRISALSSVFSLVESHTGDSATTGLNNSWAVHKAQEKNSTARHRAGVAR